MAKTVTAAEMKERERAANETGLLYIQMMENAGRAAYAELRRRVPVLRRLLIVAGKGNNGGDGFVMARVAAKEGVQVRVLLAEGEPKTPDAKTNLALLEETAAEVVQDAEQALFGAVAEGAVQADTTVTFDCTKPLHFAETSKPLCGALVCADIGIGKALGEDET